MSKDICTCSPLRRLTRRITVIYDQYLLPDALTITQYSLISKVGRAPVTNPELAVVMGMDRSTLSRALKPLIAAGWIETFDPPAEAHLDKRSFALKLTVSGRAKLDQARPNWQRAQDEIDRLLGPELSDRLDQTVSDAYQRLQAD
jgi:DNA-binding MarR family transcriptional regulator